MRFSFPVGGENERPLEFFQQEDQGLRFHFVLVLVFADRGGYDADRARVGRYIDLVPDRRCSGDVVDGELADIRLILE